MIAFPLTVALIAILAGGHELFRLRRVRRERESKDLYCLRRQKSARYYVAWNKTSGWRLW